MSYFSFAMFCLRLTSLDQCCFYYTCFQTKSKEKTLCTRSGQLLRYKVFFTFIGFACAARDRSSQTYPVCDRLSEDDNRYFLLSRSHFLPEIRLTSQHLPRLAHNISMPGSPDRCCNILPPDPPTHPRFRFLHVRSGARLPPAKNAGQTAIHSLFLHRAEIREQTNAEKTSGYSPDFPLFFQETTPLRSIRSRWASPPGTARHLHRTKAPLSHICCVPSLPHLPHRFPGSVLHNP